MVDAIPPAPPLPLLFGTDDDAFASPPQSPSPSPPLPVAAAPEVLIDEVGAALWDTLRELSATRRRNLARIAAVRAAVEASLRDAPPPPRLAHQVRSFVDATAARYFRQAEAAAAAEVSLAAPEAAVAAPPAPVTPAVLPRREPRSDAPALCLALEAAVADATAAWRTWVAAAPGGDASRFIPVAGLRELPPDASGPWTPQPPPPLPCARRGKGGIASKPEEEGTAAALARRCAALAAALQP